MQPPGLSFVPSLGGDAAHTAHLPDCLQANPGQTKPSGEAKGREISPSSLPVWDQGSLPHF